MSATTSPSAPSTPEPVTFALTEEQQLLRSMARDLLAERATPERVRGVMLEHGGFDQPLWDELAGLGLTGLLVPEELGGAGSSFVEVSIVLEELGRRLAPVPYLASAVLGTTAVLHGATDEQQRRILPDVAAGASRLALAHLDAGGHLTSPPGIHAVRDGDGWVLDGQAGYVIDGQTATHLIVAAATDDGLELFHVGGEADGLSREAIEVLDLTRPMAQVTAAGLRVAEEDRLGAGEPVAALHAALAAGTTAIACEQLGGIQHTLEAATAFARERVQFGRAIGSFQAVKHKLADMLVATESSRSTAEHAARILARGDREELAIATPMAKAYCSEVYEQATGDAIQIHGGIGFTWEHDAHLYFKRAKSTKLLLGDPRHQRALVGDVLGI
ncbi:MAG: acyl-CoA dehydrogenase family protein [Nitriliruptoraceae bacterium]